MNNRSAVNRIVNNRLHFDTTLSKRTAPHTIVHTVSCFILSSPRGGDLFFCCVHTPPGRTPRPRGDLFFFFGTTRGGIYPGGEAKNSHNVHTQTHIEMDKVNEQAEESLRGEEKTEDSNQSTWGSLALGGTGSSDTKRKDPETQKVVVSVA